MYHPFLRNSYQPEHELSMLYRRRSDRREYAARRDRQPLYIRSVDVHPHQNYEMRLVNVAETHQAVDEQVLVYNDSENYVLEENVQVNDESVMIEGNAELTQTKVKDHGVIEIHELDQDPPIVIPLSVTVTQSTTPVTKSSVSEATSSSVLTTPEDDKSLLDEEDEEAATVINEENTERETSVERGKKDVEVFAPDPSNEEHEKPTAEIPSAMEGAPSWAIFLWKQLEELKDCVDENTKAVRRQHQEIFRRSEHLPDGMPFQNLEDFLKFESASREDFDTLVGYFVHMGRSSAHECAHDFFRESFVPNEHVTPYVTAHGKGLHKPRSLLKSRFAKACREAMCMSNKFTPPTDAEFEDVMEKALKATKNRRGTRVAQGLLVSEMRGGSLKKKAQSRQ